MEYMIDVEIGWYCISCGAYQLILLSMVRRANFKTVACVRCGHSNPLAYMPHAQPELPAGGER